MGIEPPNLQARIEILRKKAYNFNQITTISDDVYQFIAEHIETDIRILECAIRKLITLSVFEESEITVDFAKKALKDFISEQ